MRRRWTLLLVACIAWMMTGRPVDIGLLILVPPLFAWASNVTLTLERRLTDADLWKLIERG